MSTIITKYLLIDNNNGIIYQNIIGDICLFYTSILQRIKTDIIVKRFCVTFDDNRNKRTFYCIDANDEIYKIAEHCSNLRLIYGCQNLHLVYCGKLLPKHIRGDLLIYFDHKKGESLYNRSGYKILSHTNGAVEIPKCNKYSRVNRDGSVIALHYNNSITYFNNFSTFALSNAGKIDEFYNISNTSGTACLIITICGNNIKIFDIQSRKSIYSANDYCSIMRQDTLTYITTSNKIYSVGEEVCVQIPNKFAQVSTCSQVYVKKDEKCYYTLLCVDGSIIKISTTDDIEFEFIETNAVNAVKLTTSGYVDSNGDKFILSNDGYAINIRDVAMFTRKNNTILSENEIILTLAREAYDYGVLISYMMPDVEFIFC